LATTTTIPCYDSDGGTNYYTYGYVKDKYGTYYDYCKSSNYLNEYYCSGGTGSSVGYFCPYPYVCSNGRCTIAMTTTTISQKSFRNAYWQCYDGKESYQGGPSSCKTSETWRKYAEDFCKGHCNPTTGKCGVNSFSVWNEC
ncbi:MAG: hypothetical protein QXY62_03805, partial [Candidatus Altiarchaeota archaeon]